MKKLMWIWVAIFCATAVSAQHAVIRPSLDEYLRIKNALVGGEMQQVAASGMELSVRLTSLGHEKMNSRERKVFLKYRDSLIHRAQLIGTTRDLEGMRNEFAQLSEELWAVVMLSDDVGMPLYFMYCPMRKAYWISADPKVRNPYYGSEMLSCGTIDQNKE